MLKFKLRTHFFPVVIIVFLLITIVFQNKKKYVPVKRNSEHIPRISRKNGKFNGHDGDEQATQKSTEKTKNFKDGGSNKNGDSLIKSRTEIFAEIKRIEKMIKSLKNNSFHASPYPEVAFKTYRDRKRILVAGGAGFVGSHLVDELMLQGHEVTVVDNFATGHKSNVEQWVGHENFELLNHDIINPLHLEVDHIYHLASPSYHSNAIKTIKTNTIGTINLLGLAKRVGARLLFASSSEVYGVPKSNPLPESYWGHVDPLGEGVGEAKRIAETMCYAYQKQERVDVRVARIFNAIGPRMRLSAKGVVPSLMSQALNNLPITLPTSNHSVTFLYVSDLTRALISLMNSSHSSPLNIGSARQTPLSHIAHLLATIAGKNNKNIEHVNGVFGDVIRRVPDVTEARRVLGWREEMDLKEALRSSMRYFMQQQQGFSGD